MRRVVAAFVRGSCFGEVLRTRQLLVLLLVVDMKCGVEIARAYRGAIEDVAVDCGVQWLLSSRGDHVLGRCSVRVGY